MTIERLFVRDVTISHPALVASGYGDGTEEDWDTATTVETKGWLAHRTETEIESATRDAAASTHILRLPAGTVIGERDRVTVDAQTFEVVGPPARWWRTQGEHHVSVVLNTVDG